jgi:hypothetical protein
MSEPNRAWLIVGHSKSRKKNDAYFTPSYAINAFLKREKFDKSESFCEPACGSGRISEAIKKFYGKNVDLFSSDLYDYNYGDEIGIDFSKNYHTKFKKEEWFSEKSFDRVISNPPYRKDILIPIIKNCKFIARKSVSLLLKLTHLSGKERYKEIYQDKEFPLAKIYVFVQRLQFGVVNKKTGKKQSPTLDHALFHFVRGYEGSPTIEWIYFNKKKKKLEEKL